MDKSTKLNHFIYILIYASIWGFLEATLGWSLQFLAIQVSGFVMFPLAMYILLSAYRKLESARSLVAIGVVAGVIKLVNLLLPGLPPIKTINPAIALVLEASFAALFIPALMKVKGAARLGFSTLLNLSWRGAFLLTALAIQVLWVIPMGLLKSGEMIFSYLVVNGLVSSLITWMIVMIEARPGLSLSIKLKKPSIWALPLLAGSVGAQLFL
ncbi:MAG: hypothetical protein PQJ59_05805 [Spirochaetales bacterium]|nr:hypothetical protein [Spirochaetales bacterium]